MCNNQVQMHSCTNGLQKFLCKCKNSHGVRPSPSTTRRRASYDEQRQPLQGKTTDSFLGNKGERILSGRFTVLEDILLKGIVIFFITRGLCTVNAKTALKVYQAIYDAYESSCLFPFISTHREKYSFFHLENITHS